MKISFGRYKGHRIKNKINKGTRPSLSRVRDVLFNTLGDIENLIFLDLFAGTGIVGIEAISLGCKLVIFVEKEINLINKLRLNLTNFNIKNYIILNRDYKQAINILKRKEIYPDVIFCDPPYRLKSIYENILEDLKEITKSQQIIILEKYRNSKEIINDNFMLVKQKEVSNTKLVFYRARGVNY